MRKLETRRARKAPSGEAAEQPKPQTEPPKSSPVQAKPQDTLIIEPSGEITPPPAIATQQTVNERIIAKSDMQRKNALNWYHRHREEVNKRRRQRYSKKNYAKKGSAPGVAEAAPKT